MLWYFQLKAKAKQKSLMEKRGLFFEVHLNQDSLKLLADLLRWSRMRSLKVRPHLQEAADIVSDEFISYYLK